MKYQVKAKTKTPQPLIHIKHTITARQCKYWYLMLRLYTERYEKDDLNLDEKGFFFVRKQDITDLLGYEPVNAELKRDMEGLRKEPITINYCEKDGEKMTHGMGFISEWKVSSKRIGFKFPSFIDDVIKGKTEAKKMFTLMNWEIFNSFTGKYEAIIYKACKDYMGISRTRFFTIEEYREYIGLRDGQYSSIDDLRKRCIKNPVKNINKNEMSDITVSVEFKKEGRKTVGLFFSCKKKKQPSLPFPEFEPNPAFMFSKINISVEQQTAYLEQYETRQIEAIIQRANEYAEDTKQKGKTVNIGAIYKTAFADGWGLDSLEYQEQTKAEAKAKKQAKAEAKKQAEAEAKKIAEAEEKEREEYRQLFNKLPDKIKEKVISDVLERSPNFMKKTLKTASEKHGFDVMSSSTPFLSAYIEMLKIEGS